MNVQGKEKNKLNYDKKDKKKEEGSIYAYFIAFILADPGTRHIAPGRPRCMLCISNS
jgi:hypothetical protein